MGFGGWVESVCLAPGDGAGGAVEGGSGGPADLGWFLGSGLVRSGPGVVSSAGTVGTRMRAVYELFCMRNQR